MKRFDFQKIKEFREALNMTQESLAIALTTAEKRVRVQQVSDWERGVCGLSVTSLIKLCEALKKSTDDFFVDIDL